MYIHSVRVFGHLLGTCTISIPLHGVYVGKIGFLHQYQTDSEGTKQLAELLTENVESCYFVSDKICD
jgi:hypothetical protein